MEEKEQSVFELLQEVGAIRPTGHYVYTSGRHGSGYIEMKYLAAQSQLAARILAGLAERLFQSRPRVLLAPATDGAVLAALLALPLANLNCPVKVVWAEKAVGGWSLDQIFAGLLARQNVWVFDDVVTTGGTARSLVKLARRCGGMVGGAATVVRRGAVTAEDLDVGNFQRLLTLPLESMNAAECTLCRDGVQINTDFGHSQEFQERQKTQNQELPT